MTGDKPHVVSVDGHDRWDWRVKVSDQRTYYASKRQFPDELAVYVAITKLLEEQTNEQPDP